MSLHSCIERKPDERMKSGGRSLDGEVTGQGRVSLHRGTVRPVVDLLTLGQ
jgi:hypothetical protein